MSIYERFGIEPIINVAGSITFYGGALMKSEALDAMYEAAKHSVRLDELLAAASKVIAEITHAEAGLVTAGASAALTLGTAACIAGFDVAKMNRLPDTTGMPNEVIMPWHQISGYDHAIKAAGTKLIGVGIPSATTHPDEIYVTTKWDIEGAITESTVAIAYAYLEDSHPPLEEVIALGKKYNIPVIIDAADQVPPVENLHRLIDIGADLVCFSGGKGIRGSQGSGILCGRRDLISSAAIQMLLIAGGPFEKWEPPASLIPKEKLRGSPEHGIGRGAKVTKEEIVGLLVALQNLTEEKVAQEAEHLRQLLGDIAARLEGIVGVEVRITEDYKGGSPQLEVKIDEQIVGKSAAEVSQRLKNGKPRIYVRERYLRKGIIIIHSINLDDETAKIVGERLYSIIAG